MQSESKILSLLGRERKLFDRDLDRWREAIDEKVRSSSFLVLGGAGSIGQAVVKALFERRPERLHVVDLSENNLVELVRDIRSSLGYIEGDFQTLPLDLGGAESRAFVRRNAPYDYVLNLAAMKHVRSEKDPFTLMRMVQTNVLNTELTIRDAIETGCGRYFAVSSDKAANPANAMGATKRLMELCLIGASADLPVTSARFANVAFSDGSLLYGFAHRLAKRQPIAAPEDVERYFITAHEAAILCLFGCVLGDNREAVFPRPHGDFRPLTFRTIAERYLRERGLEPHPCGSEEEARARVDELAAAGSWPCFFFSSDTTGEKMLEEFVMADEEVDLARYEELGVIRWPAPGSADGDLERCLRALTTLRASGGWTRKEILDELKTMLPELEHREEGKFLDSRM